MKKKIAAIILSVLCLTLLLPATAFAENSYTLGFTNPASGQLNLKPGYTNAVTVEFAASPQLTGDKFVAVVDSGDTTIVQVAKKPSSNTEYIVYGSKNGSTSIQFVVTDGRSQMLSNVVTLNVTFSDTESYTVTFDTDGGTPEPENQDVEEGGKVVKPADPVKAGYTFDGWTAYYVGQEDGKNWNFDTDVVSADTNMVASWKKTYTVTFDTDGGTPEPEDQVVEEGEKVVKPADPVKAGYTFDGWTAYYVGQKDGKNWNFDTDAVSADTNMIASWKEAGESIESVTVQMDNPVYGQKVMSASCTVSAVPVDSVKVMKDSWQKFPTGTDPDEAETVTDPEEVFQKGYEYFYSVTFEVEDGYGVTDNTKCTFNGNDDEICLYDSRFVLEEIFTPSEAPAEEPTTKAPKTGDSNNMWLYVLAGILALGVMGGVVLKRKAER